MKNLSYLLALHSIEGLGSVRLKMLLDYFEDPKLAWEASKKEWESLRLQRRVIEGWINVRKKLDPEDYLQRILKSGVGILTFFDPDYPALLKQIYDAPLILYFKGNKKILNQKSIGVVGTRQVTGYGRAVTEKLTQELVEARLVIVSGLARGVDSIAHRTVIDNGGLTVAVLGAGLNNIYPPENLRLSQEIIDKGGVVLCENPPDYLIVPGVFPSRNRIISGLSLGVLVTEAAKDSGSLITARFALEQGREVFAVPGPITSYFSAGPANLIKEGAKLVTSAEDILSELGIGANKRVTLSASEESSFSDLEKQILKFLENEQKHIDEISKKLNKPSSEVSASLIKLEIQGIIKSLGGGVYIKSFPAEKIGFSKSSS